MYHDILNVFTRLFVDFAKWVSYSGLLEKSCPAKACESERLLGCNFRCFKEKEDCQQLPI